jgi:hypothetical protein
MTNHSVDERNPNLQAIAYHAMLDEGFSPEISPAAKEEMKRV